MQDFEPDLMLVDLLVFGGMATADKYGIPKAMLIPAAAPPMLNYMIGSGSHLLATVPQFNSALPRGMVSNIACLHSSTCVHSAARHPPAVPYLVCTPVALGLRLKCASIQGANLVCC